MDRAIDQVSGRITEPYILKKKMRGAKQEDTIGIVVMEMVM
jgi:hypothetical protein